jgi:Flp pilus assembly protein TadG
MQLKRQRGVAAVELAIVAPVLIVIVLGTAQFGWLLGNYVMVANAASAGGQTFSAQRGATSPYSATQTQVNSSSALLTTTNLSFTTLVNNTQCQSDTDCASALTSAMGQAATVTVSYAFTPLLKGSVFGLVTMPSTLSSTVVERVQ